MFSKLFLLVAVFTCAHALDASLYDVNLTPENIQRDGFPAEVHHVTTGDGYILEMHRIPHGRGQEYSSERPIVFMMHGLLAASNCYIMLGPELAPAYNLADAGFDVWMGNAKGTRNSRVHLSLDPDHNRQKKEFFDFTWEEIATKDLPAMIDYALEHTGRSQLHYIGHSQGGTVFFVLNSLKPEYNAKIASAHLLAGVGYQNHFPNSELGTLASFTTPIYASAVAMGMVELFSPNFSLPLDASVKTSDLCLKDSQHKDLCNKIGSKSILDGIDIDLEGMLPELSGYEPAGAALKQVAHYGQNVRDKTFSRWSYGAIGNLAVYGSRVAPKYDLSLITIKTTMHYAAGDILLDERDVNAMAAVMQNAVPRKVPREDFRHTDFVVADDAKELVFDYIVEALKAESGLA